MTYLSPEMQQADPEVFEILEAEDQRQHNTVRLIASENYTSKAVMEATGSRLTNKYSEGYPGKRYYQGQENTDRIERLACERAKALFGADHVNIQPYSGSPANLAAFYALLEPGDKVLGMGLPFGGHLTHGWKVSFSGRFYDAHAYAVDPTTEQIDYDAVAAQAREVRPKMLICGASAYPRFIDFERFAEIAHDVGAVLLADIAHIAGLVAAGVHPSPVEVADVVTTTTHKTLRGPRGGMILCKSEHAKAIDRAVFPGLQGGPHMNAVAAAAVAFGEANTDSFKAYAQQVVDNARALAEGLLTYDLRLVTGGTDNHLVLLDLSPRDIGGRAAAVALEAAGIVVNSNSIPFDTRKPFDPSGIRIGTAAVTTRGMDQAAMGQIADFIGRALNSIDDDAALNAIRADVEAFCADYPIP
ncbi:serine hydroxymethyltransferase [Bradymonadaceae bacterium TMQ3]|uniref:Serine hydroxymethyltransferase n=2 Tax=Lujinxingia sediminis TaxID=2480984 RepID=A0ABY0CYG4_9DELT|nr:serine hydroxymethyltransferase [Lujinxingia sediminis]RDV39027.1 serine hydroxymethyltransferase [Bradymonadaceae bacterium TMQ3]RVU48926.1 serine hydroxymethyltransferase [Lujinxingia sediminis]TXC78220.1 serine hydroxymethyltransferase [Bradymonadales bacterium TMQ1]